MARQEGQGPTSAMRHSLIKRLPMALAGTAILAFFGLIAFWISEQLSKPLPKPADTPQIVNVVRPPPPPPPEEEPPPPPPEIEEEVEIPEETEALEEEVAQSDEPPPGDLGLDADGVAGEDAFGLKARKGGRSLLDSAGGGGDRFLFGEVQDVLVDRLSQVPELREENYELNNVLVGFDDRGCIRELRLDRGTGDAQRDALLRESVQGVCMENRRTAERVASKKLRLRIASR